MSNCLQDTGRPLFIWIRHLCRTSYADSRINRLVNGGTSPLPSGFQKWMWAHEVALRYLRMRKDPIPAYRAIEFNDAICSRYGVYRGPIEQRDVHGCGLLLVDERGRIRCAAPLFPDFGPADKAVARAIAKRDQFLKKKNLPDGSALDTQVLLIEAMEIVNAKAGIRRTQGRGTAKCRAIDGPALVNHSGGGQ